VKTEKNKRMLQRIIYFCRVAAARAWPVLF